MKKNNEVTFKDSSIDLNELISVIWKNKNIIIFTTLFFFIIGCIYSLSLPNIYRSSSTFYPHYENSDKSSFQNLAGLAGISLGNEESNNIPTNLYPHLLKSTPFKEKLLKEELIFLDNKISYRDYLLSKENKKYEFNIQKIIMYPVTKIIDILKHNDNNEISKNFNSEIGLINISELNYGLHKKLDELITINVNKKDGFIQLNVDDENPLMSSKIAIKAEEIFQKSIIDFKIKNIKTIYDFTSDQLSIAKSELYKLQDSLANFRDSNKNIKSDLFLNQLNRIETEYNIAKNIHNELALNKQKTAIDVRKNTPIFTIIDPVVVPNEKYKPFRKNIVITLTFLGFVIGLISILLKYQFFNILKIIKS